MKITHCEVIESLFLSITAVNSYQIIIRDVIRPVCFLVMYG